MIKNWASVALSLIAGAVLLGTAVPRTIAAIAMIPGKPVLREIQNLRAVPRDRLGILIAAQRRGLRFGESGRKWTDLGLAQLLLARGDGMQGGVGKEMLFQAIASLRTGLALAPANPFVWTRLAYAQSLMTGPSPSVASALRMAMLTARYEPRLLFIRLELCLRSWPYFRTDDHELVFQQVRLAWRKHGERLVDQFMMVGKEMLFQAIASLRTGLALAPANPFVWTRLAYAQSLMTGPSPSVASALRMAMLTARYEPRLLFIRLELCLRSWPYFRTDDHELVFQQVRLAWRKHGERLVDMAVETGRVNVVRAALLISRKDILAFEKRLRKRAS